VIHGSTIVSKISSLKSQRATRRTKGDRIALVAVAVGIIGLSWTGIAVAAQQGHAQSNFLHSLGSPSQVGSTVPANGDVNPYGIVVVPSSVGKLTQGATLISNFNDKANVQGTGTTLVEVSPSGVLTTFATISALPAPDRCPGGVDLTTALSILPGGWVVVGSLPTGASGALPTANPAGCLLVLNSSGVVVETWSNANINGPWDMTETSTGSRADLYLANVLSRPQATSVTPQSGDASTIVRISISLSASAAPRMTGSVVIGSGFTSQPNKAALIQGATGVVLGSNGTLYVAETVQNRIAEIPGAPTRMNAVADGTKTLTAGGWLNAPLGLTLAPNGDVLAFNANNGNAVEVTPSGHQAAKLTLVPKGAGDLFAAAMTPDGHGLLFVNDGTNALDLATVH
jgi:hypothetical protein